MLPIRFLQASLLVVTTFGTTLPSAAAGVRVAVLDTGIAVDLPVFRARVAESSATLGSCSDTQSVADDQGHGTGVAGVIAELSPSAVLLPLRFNGKDERPTEAKMICAVDLAIRLDARVLNVSYGKSKSSPALEAAFTRASRAGLLIVAAAGNELVNRDTNPYYPATYALPGLISVAAASQRGELLTSFPDQWDYGTSYGARTIDVAAPAELVSVIRPDGGRFRVSGTSFAAAHVSAIAAEILDREPGLDGPTLKARILERARPITRSTTGGKGPFVRSGLVRIEDF